MKVPSASFLDYIGHTHFSVHLPPWKDDMLVVPSPNMLDFDGNCCPDVMNTFIPHPAHVSSELSLYRLGSDKLLSDRKLFLHDHFKPIIVKL